MYCPICDKAFEIYYIEFDEKTNLPKQQTLKAKFCPNCGYCTGS